MKSYNQIINTLLNFATGHEQVNSAGEGFNADLNEFLKNNNNGSFLFFEPRSIQQNSNLIDYVIRVYSVDFKQKDNNNLRDVISDTSQILVDLRKYLINNWEDTDIFSTQFDSVQLLPVNNFSADYLAGWYMDIRISAALIEGDCDIPATIQNCPPVAVYLNNTLIGTAFDQLYYDVVDVNGNAVGNIINGQWVVEFRQYFIENGNGGLFGVVFPEFSGGTFNTPSIKVFDGTNGDNFFDSTFLPLQNIVVNTNLSSISLSSDNFTLSLISEPPCFSFPFTINNSNGDKFQDINECPDTDNIILNDITVIENESLLPTFPVPTVINISGGTVNSVTYNSGTTSLDIDIEDCKEGIIYKRPDYSQRFIQETGDEGWHLLNGTYDYSPTGSTMQQLDYSSSNPYYTLKHQNIYGTFDRFTNSTGGTTFPGPDFVIIDHLCGLSFYDSFFNSGTLADNISDITGSTYGGYSDWRMATLEEMKMLFTYNDVGATSAITSNVFNFGLRTSTAYPEIADYCITTFSSAIKVFSRQANSNSAWRPLAVRTHLY